MAAEWGCDTWARQGGDGRESGQGRGHGRRLGTMACGAMMAHRARKQVRVVKHRCP